MNRPYVEENDAERGRLEAIVMKWTDEEMSASISPDWTVVAALMHLAFWDRQWLLKFEEWERTGVVQIPSLMLSPAVREFAERANGGMLPWWHTFTPAQARHEVVAAASAVDAKAASLPETVVEAILAVRPRTLVRAVHRREHLEEIERALATRSQVVR